MRILFSLLIIIFSLNSSSAADKPAGKLNIGDIIPENLGVDVDGHKIKASDHRGKVIVISFWATWCPPCRREIPVIDNLQKIVGKDNMRVFAVNFGESGKTFRKFTNALGDVNLSFTHDKNGRIGTRTYGINAIPHMVIVDQMGKIAHIHSGYGDETINNLVNEINALYKKPASG